MQSENRLRCIGCKELVSEEYFKSHIKTCARYEGVFIKPIANLPKNTQPLLLKFYSAELQVAQEMLKQKINKSQLDALQAYRKNIQAQMKQMQSIKGVVNAAIALHKIQKKLSNQVNPSPIFSPHSVPITTTNNQGRKTGKIGQQISYPSLDEKLEPLSCKHCGKKLDQLSNSSILFRNSQCWDQFCTTCILKYIREQYPKFYGNLPCLAKGCKKYISEKQIKQLIGQKMHKQFEQAHQQQLRKVINLTKCLKCDFEFQFQGNSSRFTCPNPKCKTQQCSQCKIFPFHTGLSCYDYEKINKTLLKYKNCRFCKVELTRANLFTSPYEALSSSCNSAACSILANRSCIKMLGCGHPCHGLKGQADCLPCLDSRCCKGMVQLCKICRTKPLQRSICVRVSCGHVFHENCLRQRLIAKHKTARITFDYCMCPICKKYMAAKIPIQHQLAQLLNNSLQKFNKIQSLAIQRLGLENRKQDNSLTDPKSIFYNKQYEYSMALYAYYECSKCKKPNYGGKRDCMSQNQELQLLDNSNKEDLICPNCCNMSLPYCQKHSRNYAQFKCKFCCNTAVWFSHGSHFCDVCYRIKAHVLILSKDSLPKCEGVNKCPIGGNHGSNGEQKGFGCTICKNRPLNSQSKIFWFL